MTLFFIEYTLNNKFDLKHDKEIIAGTSDNLIKLP